MPHAVGRCLSLHRRSHMHSEQGFVRSVRVVRTMARKQNGVKKVIKTEPMCIAGKQGKDLTNAFSAKLLKAPEHVRQFYDGTLKWQKSGKSSEQQDFIMQVLSTNDFASEYFKRMETITKIDRGVVQKDWVSWTTVCNRDGAALARVKVKQNKITTRPHSDLDPEDPTTMELDEEDRLEYKYVQESSS